MTAIREFFELCATYPWVAVGLVVAAVWLIHAIRGDD
jgi:hypothetical protein